jgi:hypothetical protein
MNTQLKKHISKKHIMLQIWGVRLLIKSIHQNIEDKNLSPYDLYNVGILVLISSRKK